MRGDTVKPSNATSIKMAVAWNLLDENS